jgi:hypothetical protein
MTQTDNRRAPHSPEEAFERLQRWYTTRTELAELKTSEVLERKDLAGYYFPDPREGTNRLDLGGGFHLKMVHCINRKVDEDAFNAVKVKDIKRLKLPMDELFVMKPTLSVSAYRGLSDEQRAFIDELLESDDGTPQMTIVAAGESDDGAAGAEVATGNATARGRGKGKGRGRRGAQAPDVPPLPPIPDMPALPDGVNFVDDENDAEPGDYFDDGERVWQMQDEGGDEYVWAEVEDPRPKQEPVRRRRRSA